LRTIGGHARRHRDRLERDYARTDYSQVQAERIIERIDRMLGLVPEVIKQAHERIISGRAVPNAEKILKQRCARRLRCRGFEHRYTPRQQLQLFPCPFLLLVEFQVAQTFAGAGDSNTWRWTSPSVESPRNGQKARLGGNTGQALQ
jgi:hypothetical protein